MSSVYRRICLSHEPPLELDEEVAASVPPLQPKDHPNCQIALGRYSYPLIEVWLPIPAFDKEGRHTGSWYDVSWLRHFPALAQATIKATGL